MPVTAEASLAACTTLAFEGRAAALASVGSQQELLDALDYASRHQLPVIPWGEGSNIVLAGDLEALVLRQANRGAEIIERDAQRARVRVVAGQNWHELVGWTLAQGLYGLENLALIPGTAGAAPIQNIGAYGVELERYLLRVDAFDIPSGRALSLDREACTFGYRDSIFKRELRDRVVIHSIDLELPLEQCPELGYPALATYLAEAGLRAPTARQVYDAVVAIRRSKLPDPASEPNAGSFFKNPVVEDARAEALQARFTGLPAYPQAEGGVKLSAAWLIDQCGWRGRREGRVGVHQQHALVLVNYGSANGSDLLALAARIAGDVAERFGVDLEIEPRIYGAPA